MALLLTDLVPHQSGVIFVALAFLQGIFLLAAIRRIRGSAPNLGREQATLPVWQKVVLSAIAIYGLLLIFVGALTKQ